MMTHSLARRFLLPSDGNSRGRVPPASPATFSKPVPVVVERANSPGGNHVTSATGGFYSAMTPDHWRAAISAHVALRARFPTDDLQPCQLPQTAGRVQSVFSREVQHV